jgi:tRNA-specific 2-thiouridylase
LGRLDDFECDVLVTGHHARTRQNGETWQLVRGNDPAKDQSYVLSMLTQAELSRTRLPVGELTKKEVRKVAAGMGMRTAHKPESMDICFVGQRDYRDFLRGAAPEAFTPGPVMDTRGEEVGRHDGVADFTVGQRRGLGLAVGEPRFVIRIDGDNATVVIGGRDELAVGEATLDQVTWTGDMPVEGPVMAQYRAHGDPVPASIHGSKLDFAEPQEAIAPGQTVAFYDDDVVLGGALIASTS